MVHAKISLVVVLIIILTLVSCSLKQSKPELVHLYDYRWTLPSSPKQAIDISQVAVELKDYDVIFFGELHNHPGVHLAQMELFAQLHRFNSKISLSMEQFERDTQAVVDQYMAGEIGEEVLIEQARAWKHYRSSYSPLVEFARERELPVIAANAPKQMVVCVGRSGLKILDKYSAEERQHVAQTINAVEGAYREKYFAFLNQDSAHKSHVDDESKKIMEKMQQRSFEAQTVRDDTMAESIAHHLQQHPGRQVLHLNGNFHSSGFLGAVERLQWRMPDLNVAVIDVIQEHEEQGQETKTLGTVLLSVRAVADKFVQEKNRDEWLKKVMKKRMKKRKDCPTHEVFGAEKG